MGEVAPPELLGAGFACVDVFRPSLTAALSYRSPPALPPGPCGGPLWEAQIWATHTHDTVEPYEDHGRNRTRAAGPGQEAGGPAPDDPSRPHRGRAPPGAGRRGCAPRPVPVARCAGQRTRCAARHPGRRLGTDPRPHLRRARVVIAADTNLLVF